MGKKKEIKEPVIPVQDKRICGGICLCQFTIVISCVSLVYLAVAVYMPSYRAFTYGMETRPVMCQAVNTVMAKNCDWASCGEWCLTKTSGFCPQIQVTTRRNGTTITLENCTELRNFSCPMVDVTTTLIRKYNCNNDTSCTNLTGVFSCRKGHCKDWSSMFLCHNHADGILVDSSRDNLKLNGFFECKHSKCLKYKTDLICDRYCVRINTTDANVFLEYHEYKDGKELGNNLFVGNCERAIAHTIVDGSEEGRKIPPKVIWTKTSNKTLLTTCHVVVTNELNITATDCINGTVIEPNKIPTPQTNFTTFWKIVENSTTQLDPTNRYLPPQNTLTIFNYSRLYINLEGCVNTLRGECEEFSKSHGNDGDNSTSQSRFICYYRKDDPSMVVARFDLNRTWMELMIAIFVPSTLFIISFITLLIIGFSVQVGDDTRMRCVLFNKKAKRKKTQEEINAEIDLVMDGIIERTNAMADQDSPTTANTAT
ncbi:Hypothetical protein NTJ_06545 [Nesidiocoris tenuis]|uniref:Uncharacterized protein n=1 Tax=Nesidiocoris tenuis TaxID=355587 RepID=A0ABN7AS66_9HEMI|nr:Hypothetical protein NTJ_06545 [Nesidiocoris tenuis]